MAAEVGSSNTAGHGALLATGTRRPVHDDEVHHLAIEEARDDQLVAGDELGVFRDDGAVCLAIGWLEVFWIVYQTYIYATAVGRVVVHHLVVAAFQFGLGHQVFQHGAVLHLRHAEDGHAVGRDVGADGRDGIGHVVELSQVFLGVPLVDALGQKLLVVFVRVVDGIEEILQIVEPDEADFICLFLLCVKARKTKYKSQKSQYGSKVFVHVRRDIRFDYAAKVGN